MNVRSVEKTNELFKKTLDETQEFVVEGYCSYGNSKRTNEYRYSSLIDENCKFKIDILEGEEELIDGVFYILKVKFYSRRGSNEFRLKVIEVIEKFENKLLINQNYFKILKNKIDKGFIDIDSYLKNLIEISIKNSNKINLGVITFKTSVAFDDIFTPVKKKYTNLFETIRYDISIENLKNIFFTIRKDEENIDLWILARGGGDLTFFNSLELLKEISSLNKPILSALGHSTDKTLSDLYTDRSFETPTSLGNYLVEILQKIYSEKNIIKDYDDILLKKKELENQAKMLKNIISNNEKVILSQKNEIATQKNEIESLKKMLEATLYNTDSLNKINSTLNNIQIKSSFDFISSFKELPSNIKLIIYFICIGTFIKIIIS